MILTRHSPTGRYYCVSVFHRIVPKFEKLVGLYTAAWKRTLRQNAGIERVLAGVAAGAGVGVGVGVVVEAGV